MHSIRWSYRATLSKSNNVCLYANGSSRAFSQSSARSRGALPVFLESSKPEISELLSKFNSEILLPYHLTKEQEKLVFSTANKAKLEAEPIEVTLGDVTLFLKHLDRNRLANRWATFRQVISQSETREDWENVVRMLEGFQEAGIQGKPDKYALVARQLNLAGMHHILLKALQRVKSTGLQMSYWQVTVQVLRAAYDKAALSEWEPEETKKALRFAKQVVELLEEEEHHTKPAKSRPEDEEYDFRGRPGVVAVPTALSAVLAKKHGGDVEDVKVLAGRLIASMEQESYTQHLDALAKKFTLTEADFSKVAQQSSHVSHCLHDILELVWVENALKTSMQVLGDNMPMAKEAQQYSSRVSQLRSTGMEATKKLRTRGGKQAVAGVFNYTQSVARKTDIV
ncbi:hypothetical protein DE146DRAFT_601571 [Phaeosphaeria sp. MPI-PUGE-AT-0046c]|nr:hypothetical protein DE146DRAFT_601571 [Phaeosphaeria sp. MPI-PUGE-AT-0046c]